MIDYFPDALAEISRVSYAATQQHHPNKEMHWDRTKSNDHADCIIRHMIGRGTKDTDGMRHTAKLAWRALALLQEELEAEAAVEEEKAEWVRLMKIMMPYVLRNINPGVIDVQV